MGKVILRGVHGTCVTVAKDIQANGFRGSAQGRAGQGVYLWHYVTDQEYAIHLAQGWYDDKYAKGDYGKFHDQRCAIICCHMEIENTELLSLDSVGSHERIRKTARILGASQAYDDYVREVDTFRKKQYGTTLKAVTSSVAYPQSVKLPSGQRLFPGADCLVVLPAGMPELEISDIIYTK